jgi:hypothetical protein
MAIRWGTFAQLSPSAASLTTLYTPLSPAISAEVIVSVANRSASPTTFRISVALAGIADDVKQYVAYDLPIKGNDVYKTKLVIASTDVIRVYATLATLSFNVYGLEKSD